MSMMQEGDVKTAVQGHRSSKTYSLQFTEKISLTAFNQMPMKFKMDGTIRNIGEVQSLHINGAGELAVALGNSAMIILKNMSDREDQAPKPERCACLKTSHNILVDNFYYCFDEQDLENRPWSEIEIEIEAVKRT